MKDDADHTKKIGSKQMSEVLSSESYSILCYVEDRWFQKEQFPAVSEIAKKTGIDQVKVVEQLSSPLLKRSLEARGIPLFADLDDILSPQQIACINLLLNVSDSRTQGEKLKALGIKPATFYGWKRQKKFMDAFRRQGERLFGDTQAQVHYALAKSAMNGDINAIKYYNQVSGRYDSSKTVELMNVKFLMQKMLETIQRHVTDPAQLQAIAQEFEALMTGSGQREITP